MYVCLELRVKNFNFHRILNPFKENQSKIFNK